MEKSTIEENYSISKYLTNDDVKLIISKHKGIKGDHFIKNYNIKNASDQILGLQCDYWRLKIYLGPRIKLLQCFLKVIPVSNAAKAKLVKFWKSFERELYFYAVIKHQIDIPDLRPWSPGFITDLLNGTAMVFQDMNELQYVMRDKYKTLDLAHTLEVLKTLSRFHASSIIYEEKKLKESGRHHSLYTDYCEKLGDNCYAMSSIYLIQCMDAGLNAIKTFSKYTEEQKKTIENRWANVWSSAMELTNASNKYRNVVCHRDLWNNNLMFHYKKLGDNMVPDDCVLVDFQAVKYQPPAGDVMQFLYCNLESNFREENLEMFLDFYHRELDNILNYNKTQSGIIDRSEFLKSAQEQRLWGAVSCARLMPVIWLDNDLTTEYFSDTVQFHDIFSKNKSAFVIRMMQLNNDYKEKVLGIFEEIADRYCL